MVTAATGILILSVMLGVSYLWILPRRKTAQRAVWKTLPVLLLGVWVLAIGGPPLLAAALFLGALGDLALAFDGDRAFMAGVAAFLASHLAYATLLVDLSDPLLIMAEPWRGMAFIAIAGLTLVVLRRVWTPAGAMALPIALYVLVFLILVGLTLGLSDPRVFIGAALFILSDIVLTIRKYGTGPGHAVDRAAAYVVWSTYYPAQLILATTLSHY